MCDEARPWRAWIQDSKLKIQERRTFSDCVHRVVVKCEDGDDFERVPRDGVPGGRAPECCCRDATAHLLFQSRHTSHMIAPFPWHLSCSWKRVNCLKRFLTLVVVCFCGVLLMRAESGLVLVKNGLLFTEKPGDEVPQVGYLLAGDDGKSRRADSGSGPSAMTGKTVDDASET